MSTVTLLQGDCLDKLKELQDNSIDSVVTDPPYEIGFMGKGWDDSGIANNPELWKEVLRVLKPGGHLLSFSHSRTYHRQAVAVEDAGFEIRDQIMWIYGSGFPKSHNIGKAVDKLEGNEREVVGTTPYKVNKNIMNGNWVGAENDVSKRQYDNITKGNSPYEGWGTALKPAHEPIVMARKPFKGSVAQNVLEWGTGGINVDASRIGTETIQQRQYDRTPEHGNQYGNGSKRESNGVITETQGRFPANIIFECTCENPYTKPAPKSGHWPKGKTKGFGEFGGGESSYEGVGPKEEGDMVIHTDPNCPCRILDEQSGTTKSSKRGAHNNKKTEHTNTYTPPQAMYSDENTYGDTGGASRFFYCPKASKKDRNEGCDDLEEKLTGHKANHRCKNCGKQKEAPISARCACVNPDYEEIPQKPQSNFHPTVKPTDLMAYLVRMITPKGGTVLDPFMGSGSTGKASVREGFNFVGIEREDEYMEIAKSRIEYEQKKNKHTQFFDV